MALRKAVACAAFLPTSIVSLTLISVRHYPMLYMPYNVNQIVDYENNPEMTVMQMGECAKQ